MAIQPRERALHYPPMPPQLHATIFALPGHSALLLRLPRVLRHLFAYTALPRRPYVGVQLLGALPRWTSGLSDRLYSVYHLPEHLRVMHVGIRTSLRAVHLGGRPQDGASSPVCRDPLESVRSLRPPGYRRDRCWSRKY